MGSTLLAIVRTGTRLLLFAAILLAGIQIPAFVTQYEQRVDAHYREVSTNVRGFQTTADLLFGGDLDALVAYYRNSDDAVFNSDANSVATIVSRYRQLDAEHQALTANAFARAMHVLFSSDPDILQETTQAYSYTIPLNAAAIVWGLALALLVTVCFESLLVCGRVFSRRLFRPGVKKESSRSGHESDLETDLRKEWQASNE